MELTREQWDHIRLLSDQVLYPEAVSFIATRGTVEGQKQMTGLLDHSRSLANLNRFVRHQGRERDWSGNKEYYKEFYQSLETYLDNLRRRAKTEFGLIPEGLMKAEERERTERFVQVLAQEFILHLAVENLWKEKTSYAE